MRTIFITGANRGIGRETALQLGETARVLGASRSGDTDYALDVSSRESMDALAAKLRDQEIRLAVLINNAGLYNGGKNPAGSARAIMDVNYYGPKYLSNALRALMAPEALVINVSSGMGELSGFSRPAAEELLRADLSESQLDELVEHYVAHGAKGVCAGWNSNPYSSSKAVLNMLTRIRFREGENMAAVCPGWVRTDMGGAGAPRSVQKGAETIVWLAQGGASKPGGKFYRDKREIPW